MDQIGNLIVSFIIVRWYFLAQKFRIQDPVFWQSRISMITLFFNFSVNKTFRSMFIWRSCPATVTANIKIQQLLQLIIINVIFRSTWRSFPATVTADIKIQQLLQLFMFTVIFRSTWRSCPATVTADIKIQQLLQLIIINVIFRSTYVYLEVISSYCDSQYQDLAGTIAHFNQFYIQEYILRVHLILYKSNPLLTQPFFTISPIFQKF